MRDTVTYRLVRAVTLTLLAAFVALPLYIIVSTSLKPLMDVRGSFAWWPTSLTIAPYIDMWTTIPLAHYFLNSVIVSASATVCSVLAAIFAAYAVARLRFPGRRAFSMVILSTQMFPGILFLLPLFLIFNQIQRVIGVQLTGSYLGMIITFMTFTLPFSVWMLAGYFSAIPVELEEAAMIDGTSRFGALMRIVLPVAKPGIVAVAVFSFISAWGEVLFASVLANKATRTLPIGLRAYAGENDVLWNELMAASVVVSIPLLVGFILVQRSLVSGLAAGAVK